MSDNEADLGVSGFGFSHSRSTVIEFSAYTAYSPQHWVTGYPLPIIPWDNLLYIFTPLVWSLVFISTLLLAAFLVLSARYGTDPVSTESYEDFIIPFRSA